MCLARPYTARRQAIKDCSVLHGRKLMSLGVMCVYGGVGGLRLVRQREREARWKLGGEYLLCLCVMCVWPWLGGGVYHTLTIHSIRCLFKTSSQSAHQFTASWHSQVLVATGHGIAAGKPSQTVSRMSGFGSEGTHVTETHLRKSATSR